MKNLNKFCKNKRICRKIREICSEKDKKLGLCGCKAKIKIGQTNGFPIISTDLECFKRF